jgi:hypothetical protein
MALDTTTDVDQISSVVDEQGNSQSPANESEQQKANERLGNRDTLKADAHSTDGTSAEPLPQHKVPEGVTPLVVAHTGNADTVFVGDSNHQPVPLASAKDSFSSPVRDTSEIYVRTPTAGDTVYVLWEKDNE